MFDVAVVGGGLVGASFALDLARQNSQLKIMVIEIKKPDFSNKTFEFDSKVYAVTPKNLDHLSDLGINLDENRIGYIDNMQVRGNRDSFIEFDKTDCNNPYLAKVIEYCNLHEAVLLKLYSMPNVEFKYGVLKEIINSIDNVQLQMTNNTMIEARWLVAADGANSFVRESCGFEVKKTPYFQSGIVANLKCSKPHHNIAHQWFLGDGVLAYLPLNGDNISIVWSADNYQELLAKTPEDLSEAVANAGEYVLGNLELTTRVKAFPLQLQLIERIYIKRVVLIGDAAHTIHPLAGQGVNLGFGDAWALAKLMAHKLTNLDNADLARYNYSRLKEVRKMQMACHLLHRLFHSHSKLIDHVRNLGLNLVNHLGVIKKILINSATNY